MAIDRDRALGAEKTFRIAAYITGGMLLLLTFEMILKYFGGVEIEAGGAFGFLALTPTGTIPSTSVNVSTWILIIHGWFYVAYLFGCFRIWSAIYGWMGEVFCGQPGRQWLISGITEA